MFEKEAGEKAVYTVTFNFGEYYEKLKADVQKTTQTKGALGHNIPLAIYLNKVKLKVDRQGKIIEVEGE